MDVEDISAIQVEAIEVILNHILYVRGVYPSQIFKKRRFYNTPVFIAAFPALNAYIANILKTLQHLLSVSRELKMVVVLSADESKHMESYCLQLQTIQANLAVDQYLVEYEQQISAALFKFADRVKHLPKLNSKARFKIHIHTTQQIFTHFCHIPEFQEFPWLQAEGNNLAQKKQQQFALLPLAKVDKLGLQMDVQILSK